MSGFWEFFVALSLIYFVGINLCYTVLTLVSFTQSALRVRQARAASAVVSTSPPPDCSQIHQRSVRYTDGGWSAQLRQRRAASRRGCPRPACGRNAG